MERRAGRRLFAADFVLLAIAVVLAVVIATELPGFLTPGYQSATSSTPVGSPIVVQFGTPSLRTVSCGAGGTAYVEAIPWANSSQPVSTGDVYLRVYEIWDGDMVSDPGAVANATPTSLCAGAPPSPTSIWYVVLSAPNGTNLLTYTQTGMWGAVTAGTGSLTFEPGMTVNLVSGASLAGTGRGLQVVGFSNYSTISGSVPL